MSQYTNISIEFVPNKLLTNEDIEDIERLCRGNCGGSILINSAIIDLNLVFNYGKEKAAEVLTHLQTLVQPANTLQNIGTFSSESMYLSYSTNIYIYTDKIFIVSEETENGWMYRIEHYKIFDVTIVPVFVFSRDIQKDDPDDTDMITKEKYIRQYLTKKSDGGKTNEREN